MSAAPLLRLWVRASGPVEMKTSVMPSVLVVAQTQTAPLVAYYKRLGRLRDVDASLSVEDVTRRVLEIVRGAN